jgi:hypothetical protein
MTDFRALCAELLDWAERTSSHYYKQADVIVRARAAVAQPAPAPTDEDLEDLAEVMNVSGNPVPAMRRALELWGNSQGILDSSPQPEPVAPDHAEICRWLSGQAHWGPHDPNIARVANLVQYALARYGTPTTQPVLVSERLPEPEDCDSEGKCWVECPAFVDDGDHGSIAYNPSWKLCRCTPSVVYDDTRWLPHHALPTPEATNV